MYHTTMRIKIELSRIKMLPYDYQYRLLGAVHKWLGKDNRWHDSISFYSYSNIQGLHSFDGSLHGDKPYMLFATSQQDLMDSLLFGISKDNTLFAGAEVCAIQEATIKVENREVFKTASPVFVKEGTLHLTFLHKESAEVMTRTANTKLSKAGYDEQVQICFWGEAKHKLIRIKDIENKCTQSKVKIIGSDKAKAFIADVGVGHSTGCGFGFLV